LQIEELWNRQGRINLKKWAGHKIRTYGIFSDAKIIVDTVFSQKVRGDFGFF
jgi:hypothetical protein